MNSCFQALLLEGASTHESVAPSTLIQSFLTATRELFGAHGAYFWRVSSGGELVGEEANGRMAERFIGARFTPDHTSALAQVLHSGKPLCTGPVPPEVYPTAARFGARSLMAVPLSASADVIGVIVYTHTTRSAFFTEEMATKATILVAQLASVIESNRLKVRSHELEQLQAIVSQLGRAATVDELVQACVVLSAKFLCCRVAYLGSLEGSTYRVRWIIENGTVRPFEASVYPRPVGSPLQSTEISWTGNIHQLSPPDQPWPSAFTSCQILNIPLLDFDGTVCGVLGVGDRLEKTDFSPDDLRKARQLADYLTPVLRSSLAFHLSNQQRHRFEVLTNLATELNSLRYPEILQALTKRAAEIFGSESATFALVQRSHTEILCAHGPSASLEKPVLRRVASALSVLISRRKEPILSGKAADLLGEEIASSCSWENIVAARLHNSSGELDGILCLANLLAPLTQIGSSLLEAFSRCASVALENARLFLRMEQANRHWMEIFDAITDLIVVHDENYRVLRVNGSLAGLMGLRPAELIGLNMHALLADSTYAMSEACPFCRVSSETGGEYVHPALERAYLVSTSRIEGPNNEGLQTIHVLKDVTDRREAERRYRELFDNIHEGLYFSTPDGRFIEVNDALVRMLGYSSRHELLGVDIPTQLYADPDGRSRFSLLLEKQGVLRNYEETLRRKDGASIHTLQNVFAVRDSQGKVVQFRGLLLDITELKNSQAQLQHERDFNLKILNNTQSIILVTDTAGQITYANRRWYENGAYDAHQFLGQPFADLVVPSRREALLSALEATLNGQQVDSLELPIRRSDGSVGQFSVNLSPMRDEQGELNSIVVVMTDITDAALIQAKLMHTEKMAAVGQLVSGVAHEVNNPLTAILGFADLLIASPDLAENAKKELRVILQEAQRTKQIVQNLLSFARQVPPQRKPLQVNSILHRTLQLRTYDFSSHGVEVIERFDEELPEVIGDSHQLQQVFLNILNNAYDAVRETGRPARIEIETSWSEGSIQVLFRDNGNGIANTERIFDPFFTTKEVGKGTGLGLSICYGIVREHGGEILCHNNSGREGATFIVRLPAAAQITQAAAAGTSQS